MPYWWGRGRRSIRLPGYDYASPGYYFVTICIQHGLPLLGEVVDGVMRLNDYGFIVQAAWEWLAARYDYVELDECIIMPDHLHGIVILTDMGRDGSRTVPTRIDKTLGRLIGAFKTVSTKHINRLRQTPGQPVWQRNYYEHIIRNQESLDRIRKYIRHNPRNLR